MATTEDWINHFSRQAKIRESHTRDYYTPNQLKESVQVVSPVTQSTDMARASLKRRNKLGRPPGSSSKKRKGVIVKVTKKKRATNAKVKKIKKSIIKKRIVKKKKK